MLTVKRCVLDVVLSKIKSIDEQNFPSFDPKLRNQKISLNYEELLEKDW